MLNGWIIHIPQAAAQKWGVLPNKGAIVSLRVPAEDETVGLDLSQHGESPKRLINPGVAE